MPYENILVKKDGAIGLVTLNQPKRLNALSSALVKELADALDSLDQDKEIRVMILTGNEKAFAAGADIKEMAEAGPFDPVLSDRMVARDRINKLSKPVIAAVSGYALGGGCELAMSCDIIIASETAQFAQPEINIGIIPGSGGTQRLTRTVGKHRAMHLVLTGEFINAAEAERVGLVSKVVPPENLLEEAKNIARTIASKPPLAVKLAKEAILKSLNSPLDEGLAHERKSFYLLFATEDQKEGMRAFLEKRKPDYKGK